MCRLTWELGIGDRVCFAGVRAELPSIYADLDVMALTSRNEGTAGALSVAAASRGLIRLRRRSG